MYKLYLVAKREYIRTVRKPSFWIATLLLPTFIGIMSFVSGYSAKNAEEKIEELAKEVDRIVIVDESGRIAPELVQGLYVMADDLDKSIVEVTNGITDAVFYYPPLVGIDASIKVYAPDLGLLSRDRFDGVASELLKQSVHSQISNNEEVAILTSTIPVESTVYKGGMVVESRFEDFIVPAVSLILYFIMVFMASNFLLMSVSEEKENRMIEIILSIMKSSELIGGKLVGLVGIVLTQVFVLATLSGLIIWYSLDTLPVSIDLSLITLNPVQILLSMFYILVGFLILSSVMIGVGSAMPTYKEAQSFSSVFVILSIFPIYFAAIILSDPNGIVAYIASYFPLTAPMVLLVRHALGELSTAEMFLSIPLLLAYIAGGFWLAFTLFKQGALEYSSKVSLKRMFS